MLYSLEDFDPDGSFCDLPESQGNTLCGPCPDEPDVTCVHDFTRMDTAEFGPVVEVTAEDVAANPECP